MNAGTREAQRYLKPVLGVPSMVTAFCQSTRVQRGRGAGQAGKSAAGDSDSTYAMAQGPKEAFWCTCSVHLRDSLLFSLVQRPLALWLCTCGCVLASPWHKVEQNMTVFSVLSHR